MTNARIDQDFTFFLPRFSEAGALLRLLVVTNLLALFSALIPMTAAQNFWCEQYFVYVFFMNWVALSFAIIADKMRSRLIRMPRLRAAVVCALIVSVIVVLYTFIVNQLFVYLHLMEPNPTLIWRSIGHNLLLTMIAGGVLLHYLYMRERLVVRERAELSARLDTLQARIRPHFLFNSMNTVLSLIDIDSRRAGMVVEDLSALFRASLQSAGEVTLYDEMVLCRRYLAIESVRLGDRLQVEWQTADEETMRKLKIPSLTLQPLLENAVVHGVEPSSRPSLITVLIEYTAGEVKIVVTNPIQPVQQILPERAATGNQMALKNIHDRLQAQYGATARLTTHRTQGFFTAYLSYPFIAPFV
ncbi:MAG: alginate biosynthesis two-component system sensor histidine kinase AlgZ [Aquirhabdus sp.]